MVVITATLPVKERHCWEGFLRSDDGCSRTPLLGDIVEKWRVGIEIAVEIDVGWVMGVEYIEVVRRRTLNDVVAEVLR